MYSVHQQMDLCALRIPQHDFNSGTFCGNMARTILVSENGHIRSQESAAVQNHSPSPQLLWIRCLHQPVSPEQHHWHLSARQSHDDPGHYCHTNGVLQEDIFHENKVDTGKLYSRHIW